ncbi:FecR domain-containing protein [Cellvibrio sp. NN19]|uniref:FecR domain-containing protein n=1 Tax=Cellvibrio chitinivorans TaxID=3102792 RepID=UPI002B40EBC4|nr:FecR domain-containing protein [Cellvibrio sp. NN19]
MSKLLLPCDPIAAQAIEWMVQLGSGDASPADFTAYQQWRNQDARHEAAAARLESSLNLFNRLPVDARATNARLLQASSQSPLQLEGRRRLLSSALGLGMFAVASGLVMNRYQPATGLLADAATGTGERKNITLPDGSELILNARTVVDWVFKPDVRQLCLRSGELIATVAPDSYRPFEIITAEGSVCAGALADDSRLLVRQDKGSSLVSAMKSALLLTHKDEQQALDEGASARFSASGITLETIAASSIGAWVDGFIELHDRPLAELIIALRDYRPGVLRVSPAAAQLRVTGSFSLDKSDQTLAALVQVLPIEVKYNTGYWVSIDKRESAS